MSEKDRANLLAIIDSTNKIMSFTKDIIDVKAFFSDEKTFDAVLMNFVIIGESVGRLTDKLKENATDIPWQKIKGFRNLVVHDYFGVDAEEVWQIIQNDLKKLKEDIEQLVKV